MRAVANVVVAMLCAVVMMCLSLAAEVASSAWVSGMYWTYRTNVVASGTGESTSAIVMFLVLASDSSFDVCRWYLAVITQWYDGTEIMFLTSHWGSTSLSAWLRWPLVADYVPPMLLPGIRGDLRQCAGSMWLLWRSEETTLRLETLRDGAVEESITLTEMARGTIGTPAGSFDDAACLSYAWNTSWLESTEGLAWWSPEVAWWVRAEGRELIGEQVVETYELALTDWGVLSAEDTAVRIASALLSTAAIDPDWADAVRTHLGMIGVELSAD
jgi:hypothetical protein